MGNSLDVSLKRRVHILTGPQLAIYTRTGTIPNCKEHGHASREEAENRLHWRLVRRISDRIVCLRSFSEPDRARLREFTGWRVLNRWSEPVLQLVTAEK